MSFFTKDDGRFQSVIGSVDRFIIPFACGVVCVCVGAQCLTSVPVIRKTVDTIANRFIPVSGTVDGESAVTAGMLTLTISPSVPNPDVTVFVNGKEVNRFRTVTVNLYVHEGDQVEIRNQAATPKPCYVVVDTNSSNMVTPGAGYELDLTGETDSVVLPAVHFVN
jgi:hypothetical protein